VGEHVIFCFASDSNFNTAIGSFMAFVKGGEPPLPQPPLVLVPPDVLIVVDNGTLGATVDYAVTALDDIDGTMPAACIPVSGSFFPLGRTSVECSATNSRDLTGTGSFNVTVEELGASGGGSGGSGGTSDNVPPFLTIPHDMSFRSSVGSVSVGFGGEAIDDKDGPVPVDCIPASGSVFPLGETTVICEARDSSGNIAIGTFIIRILDPPFPPPPPPSISGPADIVVVAPGPEGAHVNFAVSAGSPLEGSLVPSCLPSSGSLFPIGVTTVICAVTDSLGGIAELSFTVTVLPPPVGPAPAPVTVLPPGDDLPPLLDIPAPMRLPAIGPAGTEVSFNATAMDDKDGPVAVSCSPTSGFTFPVGETFVTCAATDAHGNIAIGGFTVTILAGDFPPPPPPPTITVPAPMVVEATGPGGAYVDYVATASSPLDGALPTDCFPASGSLFALGTTIVGCSATDSLGQVVHALFEITVVDTTPPVISVPSSVSVIASGLSGAIVSYPALASDIVDVEDPVSCSPASGSLFPVGSTLVTCVSTDAHGNRAETSFEVVVDLPPPPTIVVPASMTMDASASNGTQVSFTATASDWVGSSLPVTCTPSSGSDFPIGTTTVTCSATDALGRIVMGSFTVTVVSVLACPWSGFLSPIKNIKPGTDAGHKTNVFDRNQLSVKFRLEGDCAAKTDLKARFYYAEMVDGALGATQPGVSSSKAVTDNFFRFKGDKPGGQERESSGTGQYVFDWDDSRVAKGQYLIWADFGDGVDRSTVIYLR
jgi:hypothetical protein